MSPKSRAILVIHGPNLDQLDRREPKIYGKATLKEINAQLKELARQHKIRLEIFQSNHEGKIVDIIGKSSGAYDAIVINPAAYTHTSVAIRDALSACGIPAIEVRLSNIYSREEFRHTSLIAPVAKGQISGFGTYSYQLGLLAAIQLLRQSPHT